MSLHVPEPTRHTDVERVAGDLLPQAALLTRLLLRGVAPTLTRGESALLAAVEHEPRRVSELAAELAFAQPTVTQLVGRLEDRALLERSRDPHDGRAVRVSITASGRTALGDLRDAYRAVLREKLSDRSDAQVHALSAAVDVLEDLVDALRDERPA